MTTQKTSRTRYDALSHKSQTGWAGRSASKRHSLGQALLLVALDLEWDAGDDDCADRQGTLDRSRSARLSADRLLG